MYHVVQNRGIAAVASLTVHQSDKQERARQPRQVTDTPPDMIARSQWQADTAHGWSTLVKDNGAPDVQSRSHCLDTAATRRCDGAIGMDASPGPNCI